MEVCNDIREFAANCVKQTDCEIEATKNQKIGRRSGEWPSKSARDNRLNQLKGMRFAYDRIANLEILEGVSNTP